MPLPLRRTVLLAVAVVLLWAPPAGSHLVGFNPGIVDDLYTPSGEARCVYGPGNCTLHSFTYSSANDITNANLVCAEIYNPNNHSDLIGQRCTGTLSRLCIGGTHDGSGDPLHCVDQDNTMYHAGARTPSYMSGTTLRRHVIY
jgi:hypothetical protein